MESVGEIFVKYDTDKGPNYHNYTRQYDELLKNFRNKPIKYLEIGIFRGGSLRAFRETFKDATCILGLDINHDCKKYQDIVNGIFVEIGDATSAEFIKEISQKHGTFDVILDDGSHVNRDVIKTFELLFPLLNDNGLYIVEDTECYNFPGCIDPQYENHLQYFFKYTPFLNQCRPHDSCADPFKIQKKTRDVFEYSIDKIEYGCSYIGIHKKVRQHWIEH